MANTYQGFTISPVIPSRLMNDTDLEMLETLGIQREAAGDGWYLFGEDTFDGDLCIDSIADYLKSLEQDYPAGGYVPEWAGRLRAEFKELAPRSEQDAGAMLGLADLGITAEAVLQGLLRKPQNTGPDALDEIHIRGAYRCDKLRPDSHGGWAERITREDVQVVDVTDCLDLLHSGAGSCIALQEAAREVLRRWESGDLAAAVRGLDRALHDCDAARQPGLRNLLEASTGHLSEADGEILSSLARQGTRRDGMARIVAHEYGWILFPSGDAAFQAGEIEAARMLGLSEGARKLLELAHRVDAALIDIDQDGEVLEGLPVYDE